jgi:hypothetical protein
MHSADGVSNHDEFACIAAVFEVGINASWFLCNYESNAAAVLLMSRIMTR